MSNIEIVRAFIAKWEAKDVDGIVDAFADSPFYHNVPMDPLTSKDSIRAFIEPFITPATKVQWKLNSLPKMQTVWC